MMSLFIQYQKYLMLFLQGICFFAAFLTLITRNLRLQRKIGIFLLEIGAVFILGAAIVFLTYNGVSGKGAWWFVRIAKFCDYFFSLFILFSLNIYFKDLLAFNENEKKIPVLLIVSDVVLLTGALLIIVAQFTGLYYTFDESNHYVRAPGRLIATVIPALCVLLQLLCIIQNYKKIARYIRMPIILFLATPIVATILQLFVKGLYITNISTVGMAIILYVFVIKELNDSIEQAHKREIEILENYKKELEITVDKRTCELRIANEKAEHLLLNILPEPIARELTEHPDKTISQKYPNATILFTDIVGFTKMSGEMSAEDTVAMLNNLVSLFDKRAHEEGIEKIKTIGDAYMAATGLTIEENNDGAIKMLRFAVGLVNDVRKFNENSPVQIQIRVGINSGNLVAGVIGKTKFIYDVWGDTVNVASRMESTGVPMHIHVSENTYLQTKEKASFKGPYVVQVKGKGEMKGYFL